MVDRVGQQLGNYRLASLLGQGGYAEVYLGQHVRFKQQAAIKVLHAHLSEQEVEHFQQEAETIATLAHPSIIRVLDFDVQDDIPFLVMDYAPNGSLRQRFPKGSLVPLPMIVSSVKQVADALHYAHEQKFIHRDVKPENMLLGRRQEVLLSDFGIATIAHSTSSLNVGAEGTSGTLAYMAPEQIEGHPRPASDQYALGVVVYEWLCGERPFEGSASEVMAQHLSVPPMPLHERVPEIPAEIEQVVLRALAKDPKARFTSVADFSAALEQASQRVYSSTAKHPDEQPAFGLVAAKGYDTVLDEPGHLKTPTESTPSAELPVSVLEPTVYPVISELKGHDTPQSEAVAEKQQRGPLLAPTVAVVSPPLEPTMPVQRKARRLPKTTATLLIGLVVVVIAGGILGSLGLLAHFGATGTPNAAAAVHPVRGGTWTIDGDTDVFSLIPDEGGSALDNMIANALYLPLFYLNAQGYLSPGATTEVPTIQNGGVSADAKTWTFHMRPHLVWSDGAPYDARDVDFSWKLFSNPQFPNSDGAPYNLIASADVSTDNLSITFHLTQAYAPFLSMWTTGILAPLPMHHFRSIAPGKIATSPDNLNPQVVSGPFKMAESVPNDHFTLVRNPRYYLADEGLPYLNTVVFRVATEDALLKDLKTGSVDSARINFNLDLIPSLERLSGYTIVASPTSRSWEGLFFNLHNTALSHLEVRQAISMALNVQDLISGPMHGFATPLCIDQPSAMHPGYDPHFPCPLFNPAAASQLLEDNGWLKGHDGIRSKDGQRLEFEYSTAAETQYNLWRLDVEAIVQHDLRAIGIKLDIENYPSNTFFSTFLPAGKASPPTGAIENRYDIAEYTQNYLPDPDDSFLLACNQQPPNPNGQNFDFYCNHALDALYQQELSTVDPGARQAIFDSIHQIVSSELPLIELFSWPELAVVHKGTNNFQLNPFSGGSFNFQEWWCDNGKC